MFKKTDRAINVNQKTRIEITNTLIEYVLKNKYKGKKIFTQELRESISILYSKVSFTSNIVVNYKLRKTLKQKCKIWSTTHAKDIEEIQTENPFINPNVVSVCPTKYDIDNFSSCVLSKEEKNALSYGLKNPLPNRLNRNGIMAELEYFYQQKSYHTTQLGQKEQEKIKSKVRRICKNYI